MAEATSMPRFKRLQLDFAAHLRDPARNPPPMGIEDRRMQVYRELFYNNVENFIASGFPVLRTLFQDADWHALVHDYFSRHHCHTPFFHGIGKEFLDYLQNERGRPAGDPPFMLELAHYEWVEMALGISEAEIENMACNPAGDLMASAPVVSPLAWSLAYQFPVHRISANNRPSVAGVQPTYIVVYRDRRDHVGFLEINAVTARLLQLIEAEPARSGREHLEVIAQELQYPQPDVVISGGREMLEGLRQRDIILGTRLD